MYSINESDDAALIGRCQAGDTDAFEAIVRHYQRGLFNIALRMLGSDEDARDATQTTFIKAYQHLDRFDPAQRFFSWIYRILKNECLNVLRARRQSEPVPLDLPAAGIADSVEAGERTRAIQRALLALSDDYREVMVLRHFTDLSYDEIASTLGIPVKTVKSRLYSARQRLSELLIEWRIAR